MIPRAAYAFFRAHAGSWVGHAAEQALHLARAEYHAQRAGWVVSWEEDPAPEYGDHEVWCALARHDGHRGTRYSQARQCPGHEAYCAVLRFADGRVKASLGSILDPDRDYMRVVAAELAAEALAEIYAARRKKRSALAFVREHFAL